MSNTQKQVTGPKATGMMLDIIKQFDLERLALLAKHEYDDEAVVPPAGSPGAAFLEDGRDCFIAWAQREGRFPKPAEADDAGAQWHHAEAPPSQRAQAFVDLGLFFSYHAQAGDDAGISGIQQVLDQVAGTLAFNLTMEYGPLV